MYDFRFMGKKLLVPILVGCLEKFLKSLLLGVVGPADGQLEIELKGLGPPAENTGLPGYDG